MSAKKNKLKSQTSILNSEQYQHLVRPVILFGLVLLAVAICIWFFWFKLQVEVSHL